MRNKKLYSLLFIFILSIFLIGCSESESIEIIKFEQDITESNDQLLIEFKYEIVNTSDEDYYLTFKFPSYIRDALVTKMDVITIPAAINNGVAIITVDKNGPELTEETIEALLNGELPFVEQIVIGKAVKLD